MVSEFSKFAILVIMTMVVATFAIQSVLAGLG
jgi:hypothetical protein